MKPNVEWMRWMTPIDSSYVSEFSEEEAKKREWSVLDLCAYDAFTVFVGREGAQSWKQAMTGVRKALPTGLKISLAVSNEDFEIVEGERGKEWVSEMRLAAGGAVLVRPDQHILALFEKAEEALIIGAFKKHLGLP
jgi:hypothetical protein